MFKTSKSRNCAGLVVLNKKEPQLIIIRKKGIEKIVGLWYQWVMPKSAKNLAGQNTTAHKQCGGYSCDAAIPQMDAD
ncbi:MAG: hypothetical protein E7007_04540, partial [Alphaproteobacteria bacterium]|nr:hypothetical protein [Alphaproteobacteria bacterium]